MEKIRQCYRATPLSKGDDTIRLLSLDRNLQGDISGRLKVVNIGNHDTELWAALSYCWEPYADQHYAETHTDRLQEHQLFMWLDGVKFPVLENLWCALDTLLELTDTSEQPEAGQIVPSLSPSRYFWIDAICIDQENILERNQQVNLMRLIYSRAEYVIAWLGMPDLDFCEGPPRTDSVTVSVEHEPPVQHAYDAHIDAILRTPYWRRMWIVQEIVLAHKVSFSYGNFWLSEEDFLEMLDTADLIQPLGRIETLLNQKREYQRLSQQIPESGVELVETSSGSDQRWKLTLPNLLYYHRTAECQDQKDRIYGFLGLLPGDYPIAADYSLTVEDLFMNAFHVERDTAAMDHSTWQIIFWSLKISVDQERLLLLFSDYYVAGKDLAVMQAQRKKCTFREFLDWLEDEGGGSRPRPWRAALAQSHAATSHIKCPLR